MTGFLLIAVMSLGSDFLLRWSRCHPFGRWAVMAVLALGVLLGSSLELHGDLEGRAGTVLADAAEFDSGAMKGPKGAADKSGGGGDKLEVPQGLLAGPPPLRLHCAGSEPPDGPLARRPAVPQSERLLRPPNA